MKQHILICQSKYEDDFETFLIQNDFTENICFQAKSSNTNFLKDLLNMYTNDLSMFVFKAKEKQKKILRQFIADNKKYKNCILMSLKKENKMEQNNENIYDKLLVAIVPSGFNEIIVDLVKNVGESGATILGGKGVGKNYSSFMGINLENERDIVLVASSTQKAKTLISEIRKNILKSKVKGVVFTLPLDDFENFNQNE